MRAPSLKSGKSPARCISWTGHVRDCFTGVWGMSGRYRQTSSTRRLNARYVNGLRYSFSPTIKSSNHIKKSLLRIQSNIPAPTLSPPGERARTVVYDLWTLSPCTVLYSAAALSILSLPIAARSLMAIPDGERFHLPSTQGVIPMTKPGNLLTCGASLSTPTPFTRCGEMEGNKLS